MTPTASITMNLRRLGQYADSTGYNHNGFRDLAPSVFPGYIETDLVGIAPWLISPSQGPNTYPFANGNPITNIDPWGLYPALWVTSPNGTASGFAMTTIKNSAQAQAYKDNGVNGIIVGKTSVPIAVPPGVDPQGMVNTAAGFASINGPSLISSPAFALFWLPYGPNDYKYWIGPMYDAFGNFEYGATGEAAGFSDTMLQGAADFVHGGQNNLININDIQAGFGAISNGGKLGIVDYNPQSLSPVCK